MMLMAFAQLEGFDFMRATFADPLLEVLQVRLRPALAAQLVRRGPPTAHGPALYAPASYSSTLRSR